jgi:hypothetical protein
MRFFSCLALTHACLFILVGCGDDDSKPRAPTRKKDEGKDQVAQNNPPVNPQPINPQPVNPKDEVKGPQGGVQFSKKDGGNLVSNIRGSAYVTERKNELSNIGKFFILYANENPNVNKRTLNDFLTYIRRDSPAIHKLLKEGFYTMNMKAQVNTGTSIIAYEPGMYPNGYLCVRGDGSVDYVNQADWKQGLGIP